MQDRDTRGGKLAERMHGDGTIEVDEQIDSWKALARISAAQRPGGGALFRLTF